jgi:hypothetical protein
LILPFVFSISVITAKLVKVLSLSIVSDRFYYFFDNFPERICCTIHRTFEATQTRQRYGDILYNILIYINWIGSIAMAKSDAKICDGFISGEFLGEFLDVMKGESLTWIDHICDGVTDMLGTDSRQAFIVLNVILSSFFFIDRCLWAHFYKRTMFTWKELSLLLTTTFIFEISKGMEHVFLISNIFITMLYIIVWWIRCAWCIKDIPEIISTLRGENNETDTANVQTIIE